MTDNYTEEMEYEAYVDMCQRLRLPIILSYEEWLSATAPSVVEASEGS